MSWRVRVVGTWSRLRTCPSSVAAWSTCHPQVVPAANQTSAPSGDQCTPLTEAQQSESFTTPVSAPATCTAPAMPPVPGQCAKATLRPPGAMLRLRIRPAASKTTLPGGNSRRVLPWTDRTKAKVFPSELQSAARMSSRRGRGVPPLWGIVARILLGLVGPATTSPPVGAVRGTKTAICPPLVPTATPLAGSRGTATAGASRRAEKSCGFRSSQLAV
jgi:hypothetical protein